MEYETDNGDAVGYVPAILNDTTRVNLLVYLEGSTGTLIGAQIVYPDETPDVEAKNLIGIGTGDKLTFLCDYYDYGMNYRDSYKLGKMITLGKEIDISNRPVDRSKCKVTYCFTDIYQKRYWTPVAP